MLLFIIKNPKKQVLLMFKGIDIEKDQREFSCAKI